ncbi:MAG TPA: LamG domain-containing protein [Mycobacteriales bacterium]
MSVRRWLVVPTLLATVVPVGVVTLDGTAFAGGPLRQHTVVGPSAADLSTANPASSCVTEDTQAPHVNVTLLGGITLRVLASTVDGGDVQVTFDLRQKGSTQPLATATSARRRSGEVISTTVLVGTPLTDGATYQWKATVRELDAAGEPTGKPGVSPTCYLVQDGTPPASPLVSSADYPTTAYAGGVGKAGIFDLVPGDPTDLTLTGYVYGLDHTPTNPVLVGDDLTSSVAVTPWTYGPHDLFVQARDVAGNRSATVDYHFFVNEADDPVAYWELDEGAGSTVTGTVESDPTLAGPQATLSPTGVSWMTDGRVGAALHFDGVSGSVDATDARVATDRNLTVAAWVRLDNRTATGVAVSQNGTDRSGFTLGYDQSTDRWQFAVPGADSDQATVDVARSDVAPDLGVWTHLAGVYDLGTGQASLYVNGTLTGTASRAAGWDASGTVQIGRAQASGAAADFWAGGVDEVRVYDRALTTADVAAIVDAASSGPFGTWRFDETSGVTAADSSGHNHPITLGTGATFTADGYNGGGLALDGVTGTASTTEPVIRTDQNFTVAAWVKLSHADVPATIISQDGTNTAGFTLRYLPDDLGMWEFAIQPSDTATGAALNPAATFAFDTVGVWVYVAGIYDATTQKLEIRVVDSFGTSVGHGTRTTPWNATGALRIGADKTVDAGGNATYQNYFPGVVDDVNVFQAALTESQLQALTAE